MAQRQHGEGCMCYDCVTEWWAATQSSDPNRRREGRRNYRNGPPIAKNPANQEYINKCWKEEQERKQKEREEKRKQKRGGSKAAQTIVTTAWGVAQAVTSPGLAGAGASGNPQDAIDPISDIAETSQQAEADRRNSDIRGGTRDKGFRDRGSSRRR